MGCSQSATEPASQPKKITKSLSKSPKTYKKVE